MPEFGKQPLLLLQKAPFYICFIYSKPHGEKNIRILVGFYYNYHNALRERKRPKEELATSILDSARYRQVVRA